ncbi:MAG: hypothetical protein JWP97_5992 [Labilithrix sp.]|nr:hypothetical protein [Labilithrix sp.]
MGTTRLRLLRSPAVLGLVFLGVLACANGGTAAFDDGTSGSVADGAAAPVEAGHHLPPPDEDAASGSSSGSSGSSGGLDASADGPHDSGVDAAVDAAVDAGLDAGPTCATVAPSNLCGLTPQCGCAANQTCDVTNQTSGAVSCVLAGGASQGSYCTATTQCAKGLTCAYNACRPYCATAGVNCPGAGLGPCAPYYNGAGPVPNSKVCSVTCDLRNPSAVCGSNNCIFDETVNAPDCDKSGSVALYGACTKYNDCQQGLYCTDHPIFGLECEKWCRLGASDCGFDTCTDVFGATAPTSGGVKLGLCQ